MNQLTKFSRNRDLDSACDVLMGCCTSWHEAADQGGCDPCIEIAQGDSAVDMMLICEFVVDIDVLTCHVLNKP